MSRTRANRFINRESTFQLSAKRLFRNVVTELTVNEVTTLEDGATVTWDMDDNPSARVTLGGNRTLDFTNAVPGNWYTLIIVQDGTGSRDVTWDSETKWPGGTEPTLTTDADAIDVFEFFYDGSSYLGQTFGLDFDGAS